MTTSKIQTDLLGQQVKIIRGFPKSDLDGKEGEIRGVFQWAKDVGLIVEVDAQLEQLWLHAVEIIK